MPTEKPPETSKPGVFGEPDFSSFPRPTFDDWRKEAERALKGAPFEKTLVSKTPEGIDIRPYYHEADLDDLAHGPVIPGLEATDARGPFLVAQSVSEADSAGAGRVLREELKRGLSVIRLELHPAVRSGRDPGAAKDDPPSPRGIRLCSAADVALVLGDADLGSLPLQIVSDETAFGLLALVAACARDRGVDVGALRGCVAADPLGKLARTGGLERGLDDCYRDMAACAAWAASRAPGLKVAAARGGCFAEGGASAVEELACTLGCAVEYLRALDQNGIEPHAAASTFHFEFDIGADFFMEVAKLRAARLLWDRVLEACGARDAARMWIHARASAFGKTLLDPHVNMLRVTTETFAAATGGADSIETPPYDALWRAPDEFSRRVARNAQVVLREEAGLGRKVDPAGGSYYVEWLTDKVARGAWDMFTGIEGEGGMARALAAGTVQRRVAATADARLAELGRRRTVLVGTNMYADADERVSERRVRGGPSRSEEATGAAMGMGSAGKDALARLSELSGSGTAEAVEAAARAAAAGASLDAISAARPASGVAPLPVVQAIRARRLAEPYENLRRRAEAHARKTGALPAVFLAGIGPLAEHKARADFSAAYFQAGGFEVLAGPGAATPEEAAEAAAESGAGVAVLCSTDARYPELVKPFVTRLRELEPDTVAVLAGYPTDQVGDHRAAGIDEFIHLRADNLEQLTRILDKTGVA